MSIDTYCKGAWTVEEDVEIMEYICPERQNCLRYRGRYQAIPLHTYYDVVPARIGNNWGQCPERLPFWEL